MESKGPEKGGKDADGCCAERRQEALWLDLDLVDGMTRQRWILTALAGLLAAASACDVKTTMGSLTGTLVYGRVVSPGGTGIPGAAVAVGWRPMAACTTSFAVSDTVPATTDANGRYGIRVIDPAATPTVCVKVIATPPASAAFLAESLVVNDVHLDTDLWADSTRIDLVLPPKPASARPPL